MSDSPDRLSDFQTWATDLSWCSLPAQFTRFVGREHERSEIKQFFPVSRLLTLTGIGGVGKTRLALQVAHELAQEDEALFPDGIWFVSLAYLHDPAEIVPALVQKLGLWEESEQAQIALLCRFLRSKKALLILDGCEHLVEACARLVETLLHMFSGLCIFVTSRETLGIHGETIYCLAPLVVPASSDVSVVEDLTRYSATVLFLERARTIHPAFRVTPANLSALVEICLQLDGLPLAIELAATRIRMLSAPQIANLVRSGSGGRFELLSGGSRTALPHQQSLRAMMDWSYTLLSAVEQRLFLALAVFAGGWTLEAAQAVCPGQWTEDLSILEGLARLVTTSLIQVDQQPVVQTSPTGEALLVEQGRYTFLETVRLYALEKLQETDEERALQKNHLLYFLSLAEKTEPELRGAAQLPWLTYLDSEHENFCAALEYARRLHLRETGLRLANALWWFWMLRANFSIGRTWLEEIASVEESVAPALRALALCRAGHLAFFQGDLERLDVLTEKSLTLFRAFKDTQGIAVALSNLVHVALRQGNYERAQYLGEESVVLARAVGDRWYLAIAQLPLAILRIRQRDYALAIALIEEALELFHGLGDRWGIAYSLDTFGQLADAQSDYTSSLSCYEQSLKLFEQLNDRIGTARTLLHLGFSLLKQEQYTQASPVLEECLKIYRTSERRIGIARALLGLGRIKLHLSAYQEAALLLAESLYVFREHGDVRGFAEALHNLQGIAHQQGQFQQVSLLLQQSLGGQYHIDDTFDMVASLETIAASEVAQTTFSGRMRPAGWLKRVIGMLQETKQETKQTANVSWTRGIIEKNVFIAKQAQVYTHTSVKEASLTFLPWSISADATSSDRPPTQKQHLPPLTNALTSREQEVLQLLEYGLSNAQIAQRLVIGVGTVRTHLASIYSKLGVASRTAAVHFAHETHLLK
jgi:predicted ATPase/DNA-binding CsgD family transcriptional regulator